MMLPGQMVQSQPPITVQTVCAGDWINALPPDFSGTIYRVRTPYEDYETYQLERTTAAGTELTDIAMPQALFGRVFPVELSPGGDYIVFQPVADGAPLAIWDVAANEFATFALSAEESAYFPSESTPNWRQRRKIDWISPNQFIVRYFDLNNSFFLDVQAEQTFTVDTDPLEIIAAPREIITYPPIPFSETSELNVRAFSPQHTYTELLYDENIRGSGGLRLRFQIYDTQTAALRADYRSTEDDLLIFEPLWSADEGVMFLQYNRNPHKMLKQINVAEGFQEAPDFENSLYQTFGVNVSLSNLRPDLDPNGSRLLFAIHSSPGGLPYTAVYNYEAHTITAVCRESISISSPIDASLSYAIWGADEQFIGFYDSGFLNMFDTVTGQRYFFDGIGFVGWIDTPTLAQ